MQESPQAMLLFGEPVLAKRDVVRAKQKYKTAQWREFPMKDNYDKIRMEAGILGFGVLQKYVLITDIDNTKDCRAFLLDLCCTIKTGVHIIIFDSDSTIKIDAKTQAINDTWLEFVNAFKALPNTKVLNYGGDFDAKDDGLLTFVQKHFLKFGKTISSDNASVFQKIVGTNRAMICSEIEKLALCCPSEVTTDFLVDNCYTTNDDVVLYRLGDMIDRGSLMNAMAMTKEFLSNGMNANVIAETLARKARWQLVACSLWASGLSWADVDARLCQMGKFPSEVWHDDRLSLTERKGQEAKLKSHSDAIDFLVSRGFDKTCFPTPDKKNKLKGGETIPMSFIASRITSYISRQIVAPNMKVSGDNVKQRITQRAVNVYLTVTENLKLIRYDIQQSEQCLYEMLRALVDVRLPELQVPKA